MESFRRRDDRPRLSELLRHAIVADLVMEGDEIDLRPEGRRSRDPWDDRGPDEYDWISDFGRQLGMRRVGAAHSVLWFVLQELEGHCRPWPPDTDHASVRPIVELATAGLNAPEMLVILLDGPTPWRSKKIEEPCKVEKLAGRLRPLLVGALTASLTRTLDQWIAWDVPRLREIAAEKQKAREQATSAPLVKKRIPGKPRQPLTKEERAERAKEREGTGFTPTKRF